MSKTYVDFNTLLNAKGGNAVALAFRGGELGTGPTYPTGGTQRGNAKNIDYYYFSGISLRVRMLPPKRRGERTQRFKKGNTACPTNVY